jgi:Cupin-like domain
VKVKREEKISEDEFVLKYLSARQPVLITDEMRSWSALERWNWRYFQLLLGGHEVDVYDHWFEPTGRMRLTDFIAKIIGASDPDPRLSYVRWFARHLPDAGNWADNAFRALKDDWRHPEFLPNTGFVVPFAAGQRTLNAVTDAFPYRALFLSAAGASTTMHMDPWMSSALLCQVTGEKKFCLYEPTLHEDILTAVESGRDRREIAGMTPTIEDVLKPGEILFIPDGWWHHVTTLTDSISMTWNFVHVTAGPRLLEYVRSNTDDPELRVITYLLSASVPGGEISRDVLALIEDAIAVHSTVFASDRKYS